MKPQISSFFQQIADEGMVEQARKDVLRVLRLRFGEEAVSEFQEAINHMQHLEQLDALHDLAVQSRRLAAFRKGMPRS